jgi:glycosyltransferase involved in cell wall biosynthesis
MRICLVYDCLYPYTVGGAERWYRALAERLAEAGHEVSYLTLRQWPRGTDPDVRGVTVHAVGPRMELYVEGRRRILPPLVFGLGVLAHLLRHGRSYDVVHTSSFPYFSLLAAATARRGGGYRLFVDWLEVWTRDYWREYLGRAGGTVGWAVQRLCIRTRQEAFCLSRLHARRLRKEGLRVDPTVLEGVYAGSLDAEDPVPAELVVVFAGRQIPEKRATAIVPAVARARETLPTLRAEIFGDGPEHAEIVRLASELGLDGAVEAPGFVDAERVEAAMRRALCNVLPSVREGYGLVVIEAAAKGTPSIVVAAPDNAATELLAEGENGTVAPSPRPEDIAAAIVRIADAGQALRVSTVEWFRRNARRLSVTSSLDIVLRAYAEDQP